MGKSIAEDGQFALSVLKYINRKVNEFKEKDGYLYAIMEHGREFMWTAGGTVP